MRSSCVVHPSICLLYPSPEGTKLHDKLEVFLYKDSKDRLIATTNEPKLTLGGFAVLKVLQVTKIEMCIRDRIYGRRNSGTDY